MVFMSIFAIALIDTRGEDSVALKKHFLLISFLLLFVIAVVVVCCYCCCNMPYLVNISNFTRRNCLAILVFYAKVNTQKKPTANK